jgi:leader peptidase (prepilin peptidase)/N-methyltransferase
LLTVVPDWGALVAAPFVGSFLGVVIRRLPAGRPLLLARSACESCGVPLGAAELVPLVSYMVRGGRCRACGAPIGWFHPAIELAALAVAAWAFAVEGGGGLWADCLLGWTLLALAWIDAEHRILPDELTLPLVLAGLAIAWRLNGLDAAVDGAVGAALGYLLFRAVALTYRRLRGREGLGGGDAKLIAAAGAWLGWQRLADVVLLAALLGLAGALLARAAGHRLERTSAIPFGPFLALALWIVRLHLPSPLWLAATFS